MVLAPIPVTLETQCVAAALQFYYRSIYLSKQTREQQSKTKIKRSSITFDPQFSCQKKIKLLDSCLYILRCYFCRQDKHNVGQ